VHRIGGPAGGSAEVPQEGGLRAPGRTHLHQLRLHPPDADCRRREPAALCTLPVPAGRRAWDRLDIKAEFAALINAKPSEIAFIPNTTTGENLVFNGLNVMGSGGNVVTDALHFEAP